MIFLLTLTPVRLGIEEDLVPASSPNPRAAWEDTAPRIGARPRVWCDFTTKWKLVTPRETVSL
jgi:hypothetical protein